MHKQIKVDNNIYQKIGSKRKLFTLTEERVEMPPYEKYQHDLSKNVKAEDADICQVCADHGIDSVLFYCGHGGLCFLCAIKILCSSGKCYLCRQVNI